MLNEIHFPNPYQGVQDVPTKLDETPSQGGLLCASQPIPFSSLPTAMAGQSTR